MKPLLVLANPPPDERPDREALPLVRKAWRGIVPDPLRQRIYRLRRSHRAGREPSRTLSLPLDRLLMGDQGGVPAGQYAQLTGDWLYPSTPIADSPHVALLRDYEQHGDGVLAESFLPTTAYYRLVTECIRVTGGYRDATRASEAGGVARRYLDDFRADRTRPASERGYRTRPIEVRTIAHSDCFQVIEGHHRAAMAHHLGESAIAAIVRERPVLTPLQSVLLSGTWLQGRFELYQPVDSPELTKRWELVRRCRDRLDKMQRFLSQHGLMPPATTSYLDVGSAYGWFVKQMADAGFAAYGTDRDPSAAMVGRIVYGVDESNIAVEDLVHFLRRQEAPYDVVSNMSVVHHYAMRNQGVGADEVAKLLDRVTRRVLFFETGQDHEKWYQSALDGWNADYIESWLRKTTSFTHIERLGPDDDGVGEFAGNYGRMLFACWR